jgi:hypothetical protein
MMDAGRQNVTDVEAATMTRRMLVGVLVVVMGMAARPVAGQAPAVLGGHGEVVKMERDTLTVRTRTTEGRFGPTLALKVTGTSKVGTLQMQMRAGRLVPTQRDTEARDLSRGQPIAFIYTTLKDTPVLLTAVVQPPGEK